MAEKVDELEKIFKAAQDFVGKNYPCKDQQDRNIKILATMNQLIELKKLEEQQFSNSFSKALLEFIRKQQEQKGQ